MAVKISPWDASQRPLKPGNSVEDADISINPVDGTFGVRLLVDNPA
jgi:hypothetical protein